MDPVVGLLSALLPSQCVASYFPSGSLLAPAFDALLDVPCAKLVVSKALGYAIVAGSALVKLPQILKIAKAGSVAGLSGASINIEMLASTCSFAYYVGLGYPFSTWGENLFLCVQNAMIVTLYFGYSRGSFVSPAFLAAIAAYAALGTTLYLRLLPTVAMPAQMCSAPPLEHTGLQPRCAGLQQPPIRTTAGARRCNCRAACSPRRASPEVFPSCSS